MVKSILIDENANQALNKLFLNYNEQISTTGLLIGTIDESKDYITLVLPTLTNTDVEDEPTQSKDLVDSKLIINHALLIHDMLIGGCDILGIYTVDQTPALSRQILTKLFKALNEFDYYKEMKFNQERLLFLVDTKTKSINMKTLDLSIPDNKNYQSCVIKVEKNLFETYFRHLNSNYEINSIFKTANAKSHNLLKKDFLKALPLEEFFNDNKYLFLLNDKLLDENKQFSELNEFSNSNDTKLFATLMENLSSEEVLSKRISNVENNESIYELNGVCNLIVTFHKSFKLKYIKKLLIYDLMRSFNARVRLLVEDLDARKDIIGDVQLEDPNSNDVSSIEECYQTPNRVHIYLDQTLGKNIQVITDYVFPDETEDDISERVKELFDIDLVDLKTQIVYAEDLPPEIKMTQSDEITEFTEGSQNLKASNSSQKLDQIPDDKIAFLNNILFWIGAVAAIAAIILGYLSYLASSSS
ncbi:unnamed protein product [Brachionus calyciflorus]|uniref:Uncharacterized protein n=1 Tax=Brachionus calyciflorus TaxID=104777 RepID=A0A813TY31_9BILA|nr:unnamed protein product [Brachionus calyciflorus]